MSTGRTAAWFLGALALLASAGPILGQSPEELFGRGNAAYEQGRYADAAEAYRAVLRYAVEDPRVEFNLGNAEFRLGNLGRAIVHYERARRMDPVDPEIRANLEFARSFCLDRVEEPEQAAVVRWWLAVQNRLGPDRQAWLGLGVFWVIAGLVAWCSARPAGWRARHGWFLASLLLVLALVSASWWTTYTRLEGRTLAVVLDDAVEVLAGPGPNNPALFTAHEGLTLQVRSEREDWLQVSLPNGLNGWIARASVERV